MITHRFLALCSLLVFSACTQELSTPNEQMPLVQSIEGVDVLMGHYDPAEGALLIEPSVRPYLPETVVVEATGVRASIDAVLLGLFEGDRLLLDSGDFVELRPAGDTSFGAGGDAEDCQLLCGGDKTCWISCISGN